MLWTDYLNLTKIKTKRADLFHKLDLETSQRLKDVDHPLVRIFKQLIVLASVVAVVLFVAARIDEYSNWSDELYKSGKFYNLTSEGIQWSTYYGISEDCSGLPCMLKESVESPGKSYSETLPSREFPLSKYQAGEFIYYRLKLKIPDNLRNTGENLALHMLYVWALNYKIYINESLRDGGSSELVMLPIFPEDIRSDGTVFLSVFVDPTGLTYQGIANRGDLVLGKKEELRAYEYKAHDILTSNYLLYILPVATLILVFGFYFYTSATRRESFAFVLFGVLTMAALFLKSGFASEFQVFSINARKLSYAVELLASFSFVGLNIFVFRRHSRRMTLTMVALFGFTVLLIGAGLFSPLFPGKSTTILRYFTSGFSTGGLIFGMYLAVTTRKYLMEKKQSPHRQLICSMYLALFALNLIFELVTIYFHEVLGGSSIWLSYSRQLIFFVALAAITSFESGSIESQRNTAEDILNKFIGSKVAKKILTKNTSWQKGERLSATILFTDIRDFTSISEREKPEDVVALLNDHFSILVEVVTRYGGVIDKFQGDAMMAVWGVPTANPGDAENALNATLEIRSRLAIDNKAREERGEFPIRFGMGLASGQVIAGKIGGESRMEYTCIGDPVNIASRTQDLCKIIGTDLAIHESTALLLSMREPMQLCGQFNLKGKADSQKIYTVRSQTDDQSPHPKRVA